MAPLERSWKAYLKNIRKKYFRSWRPSWNPIWPPKTWLTGKISGEWPLAIQMHAIPHFEGNNVYCAITERNFEKFPSVWKKWQKCNFFVKIADFWLIIFRSSRYIFFSEQKSSNVSLLLHSIWISGHFDGNDVYCAITERIFEKFPSIWNK